MQNMPTNTLKDTKTVTNTRTEMDMAIELIVLQDQVLPKIASNSPES